MESTKLSRITHQILKSQMGLEKAPLVPTSRSMTDNTNRDCNPRNDQGPRYLPLGSIHQARGGLGALAPTSSRDLTDVWRGSGEVAKSSPLHGPVGARHFPISVWYQVLATRKMHPRTNPIHSQVSGAPPRPAASPSSGHCTRPEPTPPT